MMKFKDQDFMDEDAFDYDTDDDSEEELDPEADENEDEEELEKIEYKLEKGGDVEFAALDESGLPRSKVAYVCPRCKKIYYNEKWIKDTITDLYTVKTELAYCPKCIGKTYDNFIGIVEIYDKKLAERKEDFIEIAERVEREIEEPLPFEKIINITEKKGILFIFLNSTRMAKEIGKQLRMEFQGYIQYEWFERNQYLRVKWYDELQNQVDFKKKIAMLKELRFGMFSFEDEF
ncbi:MAG: hypothetical protein Kow0037_17410 [Calditrichia bacterium]